jgi:hypothetical protein
VTDPLLDRGGLALVALYVITAVTILLLIELRLRRHRASLNTLRQHPPSTNPEPSNELYPGLPATHLVTTCPMMPHPSGPVNHPGSHGGSTLEWRI